MLKASEIMAIRVEAVFNGSKNWQDKGRAIAIETVLLNTLLWLFYLHAILAVMFFYQ
ncbi:MAG: hypothetical protein PUP46_10995 [Endozoicomonas sp. (ex Botrylloides leachii)]|nr:hypothetical protein [Endozoicomonas sp. (ex Botrylloides leachii)]